MPDDLMPEDCATLSSGTSTRCAIGRSPPAKRLYTSEREVADVLARLCADGLLICSYGIGSRKLARTRQSVEPKQLWRIHLP